MQNDLQLLLLIIGMVVGLFLVYKAFREHHLSRRAPSIIRREFQKKIIEHAHKAAPHKKETLLQMGESDPLLDNADFSYTVLSKEESVSTFESASNSETNSDANCEAEVKEPTYEVITLTLIPRNTLAFSGLELSVVFEEEKYHYGKMKIFHCHCENDPKQPIIYSIASMVEPGIFDLSTMKTQNFHGIVLWMVFQSDSDPAIFEKMLNDAKCLAENLNATLCDEKRKQLTVQAISEIRARLQECCHHERDRQSAH